MNSMASIVLAGYCMRFWALKVLEFQVNILPIQSEMMSFTIKSVLLLWLCYLAAGFAGFAGAQDAPAEDDSLIVRQIVFAGNNKTKDAVLAREMKTKIGDRFDEQKIELDRKRIQNLQLFTRVEIQPMQTDAGIVLLVYVAERWYVFPYPILYYSERDWKKISYGAGLIHQNFRGRNIKLTGSFWLGYNPGAEFFYSNPWIGGTKQLYSHFRISATEVRNKSTEFAPFDESHKGIGVGFGKRWGHHTYLGVSFGYSQLTVPDQFKAATVAKTGSDRLPSGSVSFRYDSRDLYEYPKNGWRFELYATKTSYPGQLDYLRYGVDVRRYQPLIAGVSLAGRIAGDFGAGDTPVYSRAYLGYQERIRGHFNAHREGDNRAVASLELRFPILPVRYFNLGPENIPFGSYADNLPFGISAGIFADTGAVWQKEEKVDKDLFLSGFGFGLHIHLPYVQVLRLEKGFDASGHSEYIADVGVWF